MTTITTKDIYYGYEIDFKRLKQNIDTYDSHVENFLKKFNKKATKPTIFKGYHIVVGFTDGEPIKKLIVGFKIDTDDEFEYLPGELDDFKPYLFNKAQKFNRNLNKQIEDEDDEKFDSEDEEDDDDDEQQYEDEYVALSKCNMFVELFESSSRDKLVKSRDFKRKLSESSDIGNKNKI